jgi:hypothetical protein
MYLAATNDDLLTAPRESLSQGSVDQMLVSSNHEQPDKLDIACAKSLSIRDCMLLVFKPENPIDDLAAAVIKTLGPLESRLAGLLLEDTCFGGILKFDETVLLFSRITDGEICRMIAKDVEFRRNLVGILNPRVVSSQQRDQLFPRCKEREKIAPFRELWSGRVIQERTEFRQFFPRVPLAELDALELLHLMRQD